MLCAKVKEIPDLLNLAVSMKNNLPSLNFKN